MAQPNPYSLSIPASDTGFITCTAHAAFYQKVTISGFPSGDTVTFTGSGENVPMKCSNGTNSYSFDASAQPFTLSILFQFSTSGAGGPFSNAAINNPIAVTKVGNLTINTLTSEDYTDSDDNDSYLNIVYQSSNG